jgi:beta-glucosidase
MKTTFLYTAVILLMLPVTSCGELQQKTDINTAITPEKREGAAYERFLMLNTRVQHNRGEIDLLFIGDSITERWETMGSKVWKEYYGNLKALNLGIGADRTQHVLWRLENENVNGIEPKIAVVLIGTNNSGAGRNTTHEMHTGVVAVVEKLLEKLPNTEILLLGIFPRGRTFNEQRGKITQVNQALRLLEKHNRVHFLDFGQRFLEKGGTIPESIMPDAVHLSEEGYQIWAEAMEPLIEVLLSP